MLQIILAEDHTVVRNGLKVLLESTAEFEVVGEATNGVEVLDLLKSSKPVDALLMDINMPTMDGLSLLKELKHAYPDVPSVILSMLDNEKYITQAFMDGAKGYLLKNVSADELVFALKHVSSGGNYICSELVTNLLERWLLSTGITQTDQAKALDLSSREIEVLESIAQGFTNQEISEKLFLSKRTIEGHRQSLIEKTGSRNTAALIRFSILNGIIQ